LVSSIEFIKYIEFGIAIGIEIGIVCDSLDSDPDLQYNTSYPLSLIVVSHVNI